MSIGNRLVSPWPDPEDEGDARVAAADLARDVRRPGAAQGAARHRRSAPPRSATSRSSTSCFTVRRASARRRSRTSSPRRWAAS